MIIMMMMMMIIMEMSRWEMHVSSMTVKVIEPLDSLLSTRACVLYDVSHENDESISDMECAHVSRYVTRNFVLLLGSFHNTWCTSYCTPARFYHSFPRLWIICRTFLECLPQVLRVVLFIRCSPFKQHRPFLSIAHAHSPNAAHGKYLFTSDVPNSLIRFRLFQLFWLPFVFIWLTFLRNPTRDCKLWKAFEKRWPRKFLFRRTSETFACRLRESTSWRIWSNPSRSIARTISKLYSI